MKRRHPPCAAPFGHPSFATLLSLSLLLSSSLVPPPLRLSAPAESHQTFTVAAKSEPPSNCSFSLSLSLFYRSSLPPILKRFKRDNSSVSSMEMSAVHPSGRFRISIHALLARAIPAYRRASKSVKFSSRFIEAGNSRFSDQHASHCLSTFLPLARIRIR